MKEFPTPGTNRVVYVGTWSEFEEAVASVPHREVYTNRGADLTKSPDDPTIVIANPPTAVVLTLTKPAMKSIAEALMEVSK
jgi:hypothetical protein